MLAASRQSIPEGYEALCKQVAEPSAGGQAGPQSAADSKASEEAAASQNATTAHPGVSRVPRKPKASSGQCQIIKTQNGQGQKGPWGCLRAGPSTGPALPGSQVPPTSPGSLFQDLPNHMLEDTEIRFDHRHEVTCITYTASR